MPLVRKAGYITEVYRSRDELYLEWNICDFLNLPNESYDYYESNRFILSDVCWFLRVFPNFNSQGWVRLYLLRDDSALSTIRVTGAFGIKGSYGVEKRKEKEVEFKRGDVAFGRHEKDFCTRLELSEQRHRLMPNDSLTFTCEMKIPDTNFRDSSAQTLMLSDLEVEVLTELKTLEKQGGARALEDFGKLLDSGEGSDVTVQVGDVEFRVHKFVLFARCPALSVSLRHESAEKASNRIVVEDCDPGVFRDFLRHLYMGSVGPLSERDAFGLFRIADRYLVEDLRRRCLERVGDTLSVETFCEVVELALTHGEGELLRRATEFAARNIREIVRSVSWQNFLRQHPTEANEIFIQSLGHPCDTRKKRKVNEE